MMKHRHGSRGFTMIELLASMAITGILTVGIIATITRFLSAFEDNSFRMKSTQVADSVLESYLQNPDPIGKAVTDPLYKYGNPYHNDDLKLTGLDLLPGVKQDLTVKMHKRSQITYPDLVKRYKAQVTVSNDNMIYVTGRLADFGQPVPPAPSVAKDTPETGFPRPTLLTFSVRVQVAEARAVTAIQSGGLGKTYDQATLGEAQTNIVRHPRQWMSRTGVEAFVPSESNPDLYRPVTIDTDSTDGITATVAGWNFNFDKKIAECDSANKPITYFLMVQTPFDVYSKGPANGLYDPKYSRTYEYTTAHALGVTISYPSATMPANFPSTAIAKRKWRITVGPLPSDNTAYQRVFDVDVPVATQGYEKIIPLYHDNGNIVRINPFYQQKVVVMQIDAPTGVAGGFGRIQRVRFVY